jgi:preprotein translocase subunit SecY
VSTYGIYETGQLGQSIGLPNLLTLVLLATMMLGVVAAIVFLESGRRKVPVQYAKRIVGRRVYGGQSTHIPLKINTAGVIPPIFASSLIATPATIAGFIQIPWVQSIGNHLAPGSVIYTMLYVSLIVFFCFFYTAVVLNPVDMAENLKKYGGFVPGIRPGQKTTDYIYRLLTRITFVGSIYLAVVCVIPEILIYKVGLPFYFGGTSLLIIVGVGLDTAQQIETHMLSRNYEGFLKKARLKGRSG